MNAQPEVQVYFGRVKAFLCLFCCSPYFLLYDKGRLVRVGIAALRVGARLKERKEGGGGEEEGRKIRLAPFPPLFLSFKMVLSQAKTFVRPKKTSYFIYFSLIGIKMCGFTCFTTELDRSGFFLQGKGKGRGSGAYKSKKKQTNKVTNTHTKERSRSNNSMKIKRRISGKQGANKTWSKIQYQALYAPRPSLSTTFDHYHFTNLFDCEFKLLHVNILCFSK